MYKILSVLFPAIMVLIGTIDLSYLVTQPGGMGAGVKSVFNSVGMPDYMLYIVGVGKVAGGLVLLLRTPLVLKEWAFAGFFVWWVGAISAHVFSGHPITMLPYWMLLVFGTLLILTFMGYQKTRVIEKAGG